MTGSEAGRRDDFASFLRARRDDTVARQYRNDIELGHVLPKSLDQMLGDPVEQYRKEVDKLKPLQLGGARTLARGLLLLCQDDVLRVRATRGYEAESSVGLVAGDASEPGHSTSVRAMQRPGHDAE